MKTINLNIKNMVCPRCILVIQNELQGLGATVSTIQLGRATVQIPDTLTRSTIAARLNTYGFELLEDKEEILIEQIKLGIQNYIKLGKITIFSASFFQKVKDLP